MDELAHTNAPGSRNGKRWQDVDELLAAGIEVLTTVNVQHLESLNDVVQTITGVPQRETVPDEVVRAADQVELVDIAPEALRRRMAHGNIYPADRVDAALGNYFRLGNLTALRELALLWLAGKVDEQLDQYRTDHGIAATWETRERVVVALTGGAEGDTLIRRAARIAARNTGADLLAVHVTRSDGLTDTNPANLSRQRALVESLGGTYHQVVGDDIPTALLTFARAENATQLVLGASRRGRLAQILSAGTGVMTTAQSGSIDVHMVTHEKVGRGRRRLPRLSAGLTVRRKLLGLAVAVVLFPLLTFALTGARGSLNLTSDVLLFLLAIVGVALIGGVWPTVLAAVGGSLLLNYYFVPPLHEFTIAERNNAFAIVAFVAVALMVSAVVDLAARRTSQAARATAEAELLSVAAGDVLRGERALPAILDRVRETLRDDLGDPAGAGRRPGAGRRSAGARPPPTATGRPPGGPAGGWSPPPARSRAPGRRRATPRCRSTTWPWCCAAGCCRPRTAGCWPRSPRRPRSRCGSGGSPTRPRRPARWPRPTGPGRRCSPRSATTCAPRSPRPRRRSPRCAARACGGRTPNGPSCWPPPTSRWTG